MIINHARQHNSCVACVSPRVTLWLLTLSFTQSPLLVKQQLYTTNANLRQLCATVVPLLPSEWQHFKHSVHVDVAIMCQQPCAHQTDRTASRWICSSLRFRCLGEATQSLTVLTAVSNASFRVFIPCDGPVRTELHCYLRGMVHHKWMAHDIRRVTRCRNRSGAR